MSLRLPNAKNTLSEPNKQDRAWLREQLLAGKNSPLSDPLTSEYFQQLRALARGEL